MKKQIIAIVALLLLAAPLAAAHDPRTVAKEFSHSMMIEGAGKLTLTYKAMHWNEPAYMALKKNDQMRQRVVGSLWKNIGKLEAEFDVVIAGVKVPKGSYTFGLDFDANDNFAIVLSSGGKDTKLPLQTAGDGPLVNYLTFDFKPTDTADTFAIEGRGGKFRSSAEVKVPYLAEHDHPAEKKN
ncbi:MAG: hypothetical protein HY231_01505 [Acidobacteria bacterium]|nr:hypothetical protein [Acidobacteriota bacterium]